MGGNTNLMGICRSSYLISAYILTGGNTDLMEICRSSYLISAYILMGGNTDLMEVCRSSYLTSAYILMSGNTDLMEICRSSYRIIAYILMGGNTDLMEICRSSYLIFGIKRRQKINLGFETGIWFFRCVLSISVCKIQYLKDTKENILLFCLGTSILSITKIGSNNSNISPKFQ